MKLFSEGSFSFSYIREKKETQLFLKKMFSYFEKRKQLQEGLFKHLEEEGSDLSCLKSLNRFDKDFIAKKIVSASQRVLQEKKKILQECCTSKAAENNLT